MSNNKISYHEIKLTSFNKSNEKYCKKYIFHQFCLIYLYLETWRLKYNILLKWKTGIKIRINCTKEWTLKILYPKLHPGKKNLLIYYKSARYILKSEPGGTQTLNRLIRSQVLCSIELRVLNIYIKIEKK